MSIEPGEAVRTFVFLPRVLLPVRVAWRCRKGMAIVNRVHAWRWLVSVHTVLYASDGGTGVGVRAVRTPGAPCTHATIVGCVYMCEPVSGGLGAWCVARQQLVWHVCRPYQPPARTFVARGEYSCTLGEVTSRAARR